MIISDTAHLVGHFGHKRGQRRPFLYDLKDFMSVSEVAKTLGMSKATVNRRIKEGKIRAYKLGSVYRIKKEDLLSYLESSIYTASENAADPFANKSV